MPLPVRFLFLLIIPFLFHSCSLFEPPAQVPSFIHIDSIGLTTDYASQGTASHRIKDAWVYVDQKLIGVYQMPATIAILATGMHQIDVKPGIMVNGIASTREAYPFYTFFTATVNLTAQQITTINPMVTYYPVTQFAWREDFDATGMTMHNVKPTMDSLTTTSVDVCEGMSSAKASLTTANYYFECASINSYELPTDGSHSVYLEMNYRGSNTIRVGVLHVPDLNAVADLEDTVLDVYPSANWNKIYVDLTTVCGSYPSGTGTGYFYIFIAAVLDDGKTNADIYFDNLKLIHQ